MRQELSAITVLRCLINDIVKSYWADIVEVEAQKADTGFVVLDQIAKAA